MRHQHETHENVLKSRAFESRDSQYLCPPPISSVQNSSSLWFPLAPRVQRQTEREREEKRGEIERGERRGGPGNTVTVCVSVLLSARKYDQMTSALRSEGHNRERKRGIRGPADRKTNIAPLGRRIPAASPSVHRRGGEHASKLGQSFC